MVSEGTWVPPKNQEYVYGPEVAGVQVRVTDSCVTMLALDSVTEGAAGRAGHQIIMNHKIS